MARALDPTYRFIDTARYVTADFRDLEFERIWPHVWHLAALTTDLASPGSSTTYEFGLDSVLIVRSDDGIKAFHNVCIHRSRAIRPPGRAHINSIRCPYHQWEWELDGTMRRMPCASDFSQLKGREDLRLRSLPCEEWNGFVWIRFGEADRTLEEFLGPLGERLAAYRLPHYTLLTDQSVDLPCNWKVPVDASNENYHIPAVHPDLLDVYDDGGRGDIEILGDHALGTSEFASPSSLLADRDTLSPSLAHFLTEAGLDAQDFVGRARDVRPALQRALRARPDAYDFSGIRDAEITDYASYFVFPNVHFHIQGLHLNISRVRPDAKDPERCILDQWTFRREPAGTPGSPRPRHEHFAHGASSLGVTTDQDTANYVAVQQGLSTQRIERVIVGDKEQRMRHMHAVLDRYLGLSCP